MGGLFGLIIAFLAFFMMSFNEYRYELFVGEAFSFKNQDRVKESHFHFLMYLKYVMYDWIKMLTCCEPDWDDCKRIDSAREEAVEQMDVQLLLKRVSYLEQLIHLFFSKGEDICTYLTGGQTFEDLKKRRTIMNYYEKITQGNYPLTIENLNTIENVFALGNTLNLTRGLSETAMNVFFKNEEKNEVEESIKKAGKLCDVDEEEIGLDEDDKKIEEEMAEVFYNLPSEHREKLQKKIPLKILKRLKEINEQKVHVKKKNALEDLVS